MSDVGRDSSFGYPNAQSPSPQDTPTTASFYSPVFETPQPAHASLTDLATCSTPLFAEEYSVFNSSPGNLQASEAQFADFFPASAPQTCHNSRKRPLSSNKPRSAKKFRRDNVAKDPESQFISPPPTVHKGEQKLVKQFSMPYDHSFPQPDFTDSSQSYPHDVTALMANSADMYPHPLSTPHATPANLWDPQAAYIGMDFDFNAASHNIFLSTAASHRHTGSFDWNNDVQLFQDANISPQLSNQENIQPQQQHAANMPGNTVDPSPYQHQLVGISTVMNNGEIIDPNMILDQPNTNMHHFTGVSQPLPLKKASKATKRPPVRRTTANKSSRGNKGSDSTSPLKQSRTGGLDQATADIGGRNKLVRSNTLPTMLPAACAMTQIATGDIATESSRPTTRPNGRLSPTKSQNRLSALASIRESWPTKQRASVRFIIDARGRARAEPLTMGQDSISQGLSRSQSSRDLDSRTKWDLTSDSESEDDDPIVIPSRIRSFNASFALPDPRKPVGSIFHCPRRSRSDRSSSSAGGEKGLLNVDESDAETIVNEQRRGRCGDAASELVKLVERRQNRPSQPLTMHPGRLIINLDALSNDTISPSSLTESAGYGTDGQGVRCVCNRKGIEKHSFMVQCESCEMWLHGKCIGISPRTMTNVYICAFCANTRGKGGSRLSDDAHQVNALGIATAPLVGNKSFR